MFVALRNIQGIARHVFARDIPSIAIAILATANPNPFALTERKER